MEPSATIMLFIYDDNNLNSTTRDPYWQLTRTEKQTCSRSRIKYTINTWIKTLTPSMFSRTRYIFKNINSPDHVLERDIIINTTPTTLD